MFHSILGGMNFLLFRFCGGCAHPRLIQHKGWVLGMCCSEGGHIQLKLSDKEIYQTPTKVNRVKAIKINLIVS